MQPSQDAPDNTETTLEKTTTQPILTNPAQQPLPTPMSASQMGINNPPKTSKKKLFVVIFALLVFFGIAAGGYFVYTKLTSANLATIEYTNKLGQKYQLAFYKNAQVVPGSDLKSLGSQIGPEELLLLEPRHDDSTALAFLIAKLPNASLYDKTTLCENKPLTITGKPGEQSGEVCALMSDGKPLIYFFQATKDNENYLVEILVDYNGEQAKASPESAKELLGKVNLSNYDSDLKRILPTIKVLN